MLRTVLALAAAALALAAVPASAPAARRASRRARSRRRCSSELNQIRTSHGLRPLVASPALARSADAHAVSMGRLGYFSHTSADGTSVRPAASPASTPRRRTSSWMVGENLLFVGGASCSRRREAVAMWLESPHHRRNILEPRWRSIGIAEVFAPHAPGRFRAARTRSCSSPTSAPASSPHACPRLRRRRLPCRHGGPDRIEPPQGALRRARSSTASRSRSSGATGSRSPGRTAPARRRCCAPCVGETELHGGELAWEKGARVALHDQRPPRESSLSLREYALSGASDLVETEQELRRLEEAMAAGDHAPATLRRYGEAQSRLEHAGGYGWRDRAVAVLRGLGFADADLDRGLDTFSGGELTRASLARALAGGPDLLLLDEPTNHLDMASIEWLEQELSTIDAAVILVAHDRWFLESVSTSVLELEGGRSIFFPGKWHVWRQEKAARLAQPGEVGRAAGGGHRAAGAVRRALPLRDEVAPGAGEAEADRADREGARRGAAAAAGARSASSS